MAHKNYQYKVEVVKDGEVRYTAYFLTKESADKNKTKLAALYKGIRRTVKL